MRARAAFEYRERVLPGPSQTRGYRTVTVLGTTGSGKTTLVRQLIGSPPSGVGFPATSAFRTTVAPTEILCAPGDHYAAVTLSSADETRARLEECVAAAGVALATGERDATVRRALRSSGDQRFRLRQVLGDGPDWLDRTVEVLRRALTRAASTDPVQLAETIRHQRGVRQLVDELLDDVRGRFDVVEAGEYLRDEQGWPHAWTLASREREEFLAAVHPFVGNDHGSFGRLLTPLVNGIRVRGPFHPDWSAEIPYVMLIDNEGLGHTPDSLAALPSALLGQIERSDTIVIVDNASQPMLGGTVDAIRDLVAAGRTRDLVLCFTHFDQVIGPDLASDADRHEHLAGAVGQMLERVGDELGPARRHALATHLAANTFTFRGLDHPVHPAHATPLLALVERLRVESQPLALSASRPVLDPTTLEPLLRDALGRYLHQWRSRLGLVDGPADVEHWSRVKALCRRLAHDAADDYGSLRPVGDLVSLLVDAVADWVAAPVSWTGGEPSADEAAAHVDALARAVSQRFVDIVRVRLCDEAQDLWLAAEELSGAGSVDKRAHMVATEILAARVGPGAAGRDGAPFLAELRSIVTSEAATVGFHLDATSATARKTNGAAIASPLPSDLARRLTDDELHALQTRRRPTSANELEVLGA
ncbi:MAG: hypothetical protein S0880_13500, partial [Actinomycetota bacterium]|nr:hypothetical protein [Actinomycetota bacterium]